MTEMNFAAMRTLMVESQLRPSDVSDVRVVEAMGSVPRENFVPPGRQAMAYIDRPVPLGNGRSLNPPLATGRLLTEAAIKRGEKVLLIGAASGYTAAILSHMDAQVTAVDDANLAGKGTRPAGVTFVTTGLAAGHVDGAPYNAIVIDGAVEEVPAALIEQLADGGRLTTGIIDKGVSRLAVGRKTSGGFGLTHIADIEMVPLPGFEKLKTFVF